MRPSAVNTELEELPDSCVEIKKYISMLEHEVAQLQHRLVELKSQLRPEDREHSNYNRDADEALGKTLSVYGHKHE